MTDIDATLRPIRILLLGMMGSGKSSVGRALAAVTGWPFLDNDALVERATGRTARTLLAEEGVEALRDAESAALRVGLEVAPPAIVAVAAGVIEDPGDRERLAGAGYVVWLRAPASVLAARALGGAHRPWLESSPEAWFAARLDERDPLYAGIADLEVDTSISDADGAARRIVEALSAGG